MRIYLAGPWFTDEQFSILETTKNVLNCFGDIEYYSPKDDCLYTPGGEITPAQVFAENLIEIDKSDAIVAITDGLDAGTMFECGYAFGKTQICYLWIKNQGFKFNIMLAESASCVCLSYANLTEALSSFLINGIWPKFEYKGELE